MGIFRSLFKRPQSDSFCEKRLRPRLNCAIATEFSDAGGNTWSCKIVDMSESGFAITTAARLRMGSHVNIIRPAVSTEVVWTVENKAGLRILR
ncbi:MAG TPA: PilZ domain-containing protein [Dissulfurispiraceae bacterium]|nr:PilZ domain-containing protein [Dissulfurispiraceae bacterium]